MAKAVAGGVKEDIGGSEGISGSTIGWHGFCGDVKIEVFWGSQENERLCT
jgi:hypothetical protein